MRWSWNVPHRDLCPIGYGCRTGYTRHGCRCPPCTQANSDYMRWYRSKGYLSTDQLEAG